MQKKNRVMAILAIGAALIVAASGIARCTLGAAHEEAALEEPAQTEASAPDETSGTLELSGLYGTTWEAAEGEGTLTLLDGVMVELTDDGEKLWLYRVGDMSESAEDLKADIEATSDSGETKSGLLAIVESGSSAQLSCDLLEGDYRIDIAEPSIELVGCDGALEEATGASEGEIASAIASWASTRYPYATKATWSKETWGNWSTGVTTTTFTLDDASSTLVTVSIDADGKAEAS